jgi:serine/threonine protein kinase
MAALEPYRTGDLARLEASLATSDDPTAVPRSIARYDVLELIGQGGMGEVYRAAQRWPVERTVALKLIKLGMDSRDVVARFEGERQALAWMDHPNVARVLDGGTDPLSGRPYFVMEYVPGLPITRFCDEHRLTVRQRLELFTQVCSAVAHAHQKMVVHRDLKPSNILVVRQDGDPHVKVIDFGVAKALTSAPGDQPTLLTTGGQLVGTPEYMSPEQAGGRDVDTRTDLYSLGVVLYELLAGALPFDPGMLRDSGLAGIARTLRETDPPRPSTRLSSLGDDDAQAIAQRRQTHARELLRTLRGELEWIPLKAMRKDRAQRYATAAQLADDIANYLAHQPLVAAPESRAYRLRKFLRRRRIEVIAGALVLASLLAGVVGTTTFAVRASRQRALAERSAAETRRVADLQAEVLSTIDVPLMGARLRDDLLEQAAQGWRQSRVPEDDVARRRAALEEQLAGVSFTTAALRTLDRNVFQAALSAIDARVADQPLVKARLLQHLATALHELGLTSRATAPQMQALEIHQRLLGDDHLDTLDSQHRMARLLGKMHPNEAEPLVRAALAGRLRRLGTDHADTLTSTYLLGYVLLWQDRYGEAERYLRQALDGRRRVLGDDDPATIECIYRLGQALFLANRQDEAEPYLQDALHRSERLYGDEHSRTLLVAQTLANLRRAQGRLDEAEALYRRAFEVFRRTKGDDYRDTLFVRCKLCALMMQRGRLDEADAYLRDLTAQRIHVLGEDSADALESLRMMADLRWRQGRLAESESLYADVVPRCRRVLGPAHRATQNCARQLAGLLDELGKAREADELRRQHVADALDAFRAWRGDGEFPGLASEYYGILRKIDDEDGGLARRHVEEHRAKYGATDPRTFDAMSTLARHLAQEAKFAEAEPLARQAVQELRAARATSKYMVWALATLATILRDTGRPEQALPLYEEQKRTGQALVGEMGPRRANAAIDHAECLVLLGRFGDAERELLECEPADAPSRRSLITAHVKVFDAWHAADPTGGHDAPAARWRAELAKLKPPADWTARAPADPAHTEQAP